jgi:hypothetical protein
MMKITTPLLTVGLLVGVLVASGCGNWGGERYDPHFWHQNFLNALNSQVGRKYESARRGSWANPVDLISSVKLPNGNTAYKYPYQNPSLCNYTFEVDSKTDIIIAVTWEGEEKHCILIP